MICLMSLRRPLALRAGAPEQLRREVLAVHRRVERGQLGVEEEERLRRTSIRIVYIYIYMYILSSICVTIVCFIYCDVLSITIITQSCQQ